MTEIPEHLLKRAQARRAAMSGGAAPAEGAPAAGAAPAAGGAAPAAAAAAPAKKAAPLPTLASEPEAPKPDKAVVAAAKGRKKVPFWIAPMLMLLPIWGWIYNDSVTQPPQPETDPLVIGAEVYSKCTGCHGGDGAGTASGAQLNDGHALDTFQDPLTMVHWIAFGAKGGAHADGTYGDVNRPLINGGMPAWIEQSPPLTAKEIAAVTIYIRSQFSPDQYDEANEQGFTKEAFESDPDAIEAQAQASIDLGKTGEPDVSEIQRAE